MKHYFSFRFKICTTRDIENIIYTEEMNTNKINRYMEKIYRNFKPRNKISSVLNNI